MASFNSIASTISKTPGPNLPPTNMILKANNNSPNLIGLSAAKFLK